METHQEKSDDSSNHHGGLEPDIENVLIECRENNKAGARYDKSSQRIEPDRERE